MGAALQRRDADHLRDALSSIRALRDSGDLDASVVADRLAAAIHELVGAPAAVIRQARTSEGWGLDLFGNRGFPPGLAPDYAAALSVAPSGFFAYDPTRPAPKDRNRVRDARPTRDDTSGAYAFFERYGLADRAQTRILLCDGPMLLAWIGAVRRVGENDARDHAFITKLAVGSRPLLRLTRGFGRGRTHATLVAALDAYPGEIYLARRDGAVELTNDCGARRLGRDAAEVLPSLRDAIRGSGRGFDVVPVRFKGAPNLFLLSRAAKAPVELDARVTDARLRWGLTQRQGDILRRLALGDANKDIAAHLQMSPRTVEQHVATILERARVESRLRLIAKLWGA